MSSESLTDKIREAIKPTPMRRRIQSASIKLHMQSDKLQQKITQMESRDTSVHTKCVQALEARDPQTATLYANECVEIRKMIKTSLKSQMCLEQATMRLDTIQEFGDMAHGMNLVKNVLGSVKRELQGKLPDISTGIADVEDSLQNLTLEIGEAVEANTASMIANDESARILKEADIIAEQKMDHKFPEIPPSLTGSTRVR